MGLSVAPYPYWAAIEDMSVRKKEEPTTGWVTLCLTPLGYPDSNQERQDQNLQCYHYTIAQENLICS